SGAAGAPARSTAARRSRGEAACVDIYQGTARRRNAECATRNAAGRRSGGSIMTHLIVGCGYLGQRVAALWREQGKRVSALTRSRTGELRALGIEPIVGDVLRPQTLTALPSAEMVLYAVGFDRTAGASFRDVYVRGLGNVLAALPGQLRRFLYVSSTSVYGHNAGEEIHET